MIVPAPLFVTALSPPLRPTRSTWKATIGVRTHEVRRKTLDRELVSVATPFGEVRVKISRMNGTILNATPEYDDCQRIAAERGIPLKQVIAAASFEFQKKKEASK